MERSLPIGIALAVTAVAVLVPVLLQLRGRERRLVDVWGHFIFVAGLLTVAASYGMLAGARQQNAALVGLGAALLGLFVQHRDRDSADAQDHDG